MLYICIKSFSVCFSKNFYEFLIFCQTETVALLLTHSELWHTHQIVILKLMYILDYNPHPKVLYKLWLWGTNRDTLTELWLSYWNMYRTMTFYARYIPNYDSCCVWLMHTVTLPTIYTVYCILHQIDRLLEVVKSGLLCLF